ncbi:scarecrow-like protein 5-like isoform X1 [Hibiscus syriacus]|uniref:Scarecrow-like protein 5-like isoform X1 n=1 Tax=Hibiscus syriacus TaxID=106335 RepID=A0A6A3C9N5_HIBSY|nr:uncharacterized protein LOC120202398 isoform X2 [Hibiscus syriacus]KAE8725456.1 scarecrow-like protein 5-like isoform X1 [Hibiscus syriacus]
MEVSLCAPPSITSPVPIPQSKPTFTKCSNPTARFICTQRCKALTGNNQRLTTKVAANIQDIAAVADPGRVDITWQIVVGAAAGVTPFVVAGIEFSKRIIAQRRCEECGGSGLVFRGKDYFKCPECGGFLPWQSWKRFFTG